MSETIIFKPALQWSGALRRCMTAHPGQEARLAADAAQPVTRKVLADWYAELLGPEPVRPTPQAELRRALRRLRARVFATLAVRDVAGLAPLHEVV
ncbi:MAG: bifunctional glutamine synthetase adenylyltransferase/deadenyltransferase, partial [Castellaniella sp.]